MKTLCDFLFNAFNIIMFLIKMLQFNGDCLEALNKIQ